MSVCCAPGDGTVPALDDPCSILNQSGYLNEQAQVQEQAIQGSAGNMSSTLAQLQQYSQPQQTAALNCVSNPGMTYTDPWGNVVTCPALATDDNGIMVSAYTAQQIAAMIGNQFSNTGLPASALVGTTLPGATVAPPAATPVAIVPVPSYSANSVPVTQQQINQAASGGSPNLSTSTGTAVDLSFLTNDSLISGIPNWEVAMGALVALMILPVVINAVGGRR